MNILVFSDSHGRVLDMFNLVENLSPDAVIHLGDYDEDAQDLRRSYPDLTVYSVRGNNDYGSDSPWFSVVTPEGVKFYLTHGHREGVVWTSCGNIAEHAKKFGCSIALYGHTHCANHVIDDDIHIFNPGSISLPRQGVASCLSLEIQNGKLIDAVFLNTDGEPISLTKQKNKSKFRWF